MEDDVKPHKLAETIPELRDLTRKMHDDVKAAMRRNLTVAVAASEGDEGKGLSIVIALNAAAVAAALRELVVPVAIVLNEEVDHARAALFVLLNDGKAPFHEIIQRADGLIKLAREHGYPLAGGSYKPLSWDEQLDERIERLNRSLEELPSEERAKIEEHLAKFPEMGQMMAQSGVRFEGGRLVRGKK